MELTAYRNVTLLGIFQKVMDEIICDCLTSKLCHQMVLILIESDVLVGVLMANIVVTFGCVDLVIEEKLRKTEQLR
jgi:hypothetical protein